MIKTYRVGGSIRDELLGIESNDLDYIFFVTDSSLSIEEKIATMVYWLKDYCRNLDFVFIKTKNPLHFKVKDKRTNQLFDFILSLDPIYSNLEKRDFTINSIAREIDFSSTFPTSNCNREYIDFFGGIRDLKRKRLRTIELPEKTFERDPLRIFRAIRFKATYGFTYSHVLGEAIKQFDYSKLDLIEDDKIHLELKKIISSSSEGIYRLFEHRDACEYLFKRGFSVKFQKSRQKP